MAVTSGCDSASDDDILAEASDGVTDAASRTFRSDDSEFDGQSIAQMSAQSFLGGSYANQVRTAIAARGQAVVTALPQPDPGVQNPYVTLKAILDKADQINGSAGAAPISTHFQVDAGTESQQYLLAYAPAENGMVGLSGSVSAAHVYIVLDPAVFHPAPSTGEDTYPRDVPATRLSDGKAAKVTLREDGFSVDGDATGQLLVIEAVPVIQQEDFPESLESENPSLAVEVPGSGDNAVTSLTFLGLRILRIDRSFDGGGISGKNEVQFTAQPTDDYNLEFQRKNTRRFDNHFWTTFLNFGNPEHFGSNTLNPIYLPAFNKVLWFPTEDVNYPNRDYNVASGYFWNCNTFPYDCARIETSGDFPLIHLSGTYFRAYMSEDDWKVDRLSRRAGDWQGNIRTINFSTGGFQTLNTKLDANNHCCVSSDQVFTQSGIRRVNNTTVNTRTINGTQVYVTDSNGLKYSFTKRIVTI